MAEPVKDLRIRSVFIDTAERFARNAAARGMPQSEYLTALVEMHDRMRALADTPTSDGRWLQVGAELEALGLQTVGV